MLLLKAKLLVIAKEQKAAEISDIKGDVVEDAKRITSVTDVPLLVDIDTGWGGAFNISRTIRELSRAGVAAVHIEDQVGQKRCGHRPNKEMVSTQEMVDRIKALIIIKNLKTVLKFQYLLI